MNEPTTHIAGVPVTVNDQLQRQRCGWCGKILLDYDLSRIAVPAGQGPPATYAVGALVTVDDGISYTVELVDGKLPDDSCTRRDEPVSMISSIESEVRL